MCKWTDADRAQKHGMDEFISSNPCNFDHASLFEMVQRLTLDHRLNDSYSCLASISFDLRQLRHDIVENSNTPLPLGRSAPAPVQNPFNNYKCVFNFLRGDSFIYPGINLSRRKCSQEIQPNSLPPNLSFPLFSCYTRNLSKRVDELGTCWR